MNTHAKLSIAIPKKKAAVQHSDKAERWPQCLKRFIDLLVAADENSIEEPIRDLVAVRIAQMNACTFCLDLHVRQARNNGEHELRLHHLAAWRDSTLFGPRERAALAWTEALAGLSAAELSGGIYHEIRTELSDKEIADLSFVVITINCWNRLNAGFGLIANPTLLNLTQQ